MLCSSDGVDGYLARRHGTTTLGTFLDPLADKVLVLGAMFTLVAVDVFWIVPVVHHRRARARDQPLPHLRRGEGHQRAGEPHRASGRRSPSSSSVGFAIAPLTALDATWLWNGLLWIVGRARGDQRRAVPVAGAGREQGGCAHRMNACTAEVRGA